MMKSGYICMALSSALLLAACGKEDEPQNTPPMADMKSADMMVTPDMASSPDMTAPADMAIAPDMGDMAPEADLCMPQLTCAPGACGVRDDGCGGELDCGQCACENGQPTRGTTCGPCGLGVAVCTDEGEVTCSFPPVPEQETLDCELDVFYVDAGNAGGMEEGGKLTPYSRLSDALDRASRRAPGAQHALIVATSTGSHTIERANTPRDSATFTLPENTSLLGGYTRAFERDETAHTTIISEGATAASLIGLKSPFVLDGLELGADPISQPGLAGYGMFIRDVSALAHLSRLLVTAPAGTSGEDGRDGDRGEDGFSGADAQTPLVEDGPAPAVGAAGVAPGACPSSLGGIGGIGADHDSASGGTSGASTPGAQGGQGGIESATTEFQNGQDGQPARDANDGANGFTELEHHPGALDGAAWVHPGDGQDGQPGDHGEGGAGGGGAARFSDPGVGSFPGGSGGGGGAGGCGGGGGEKGRKGGSSIALIVQTSPSLTISNSSFSSSAAGDGGRGGQGAPGGFGAEGGEGTLTRLDSDGTMGPALNTGGHGGRGADGGHGGSASGGHGGHSYGGFCDAPISLEDVNFTTGSPGRGGKEGDGPSSSPDGVSIDQIGCIL